MTAYLIAAACLVLWTGFFCYCTYRLARRTPKVQGYEVHSTIETPAGFVLHLEGCDTNPARLVRLVGRKCIIGDFSIDYTQGTGTLTLLPCRTPDVHAVRDCGAPKPTGWYCSRPPGHPGPCAARPLPGTTPAVPVVDDPCPPGAA